MVTDFFITYLYHSKIKHFFLIESPVHIFFLTTACTIFCPFSYLSFCLCKKDL